MTSLLGEVLFDVDLETGAFLMGRSLLWVYKDQNFELGVEYEGMVVWKLVLVKFKH